MAKNSLIRKSFPKVRRVIVKGETFYQVDTRTQDATGKHGKREYFGSEEKALDRAREIDGDLNAHGREAVMALDLRAMAFRCAETLAKWGKNLDDATEFFVAHLEREKEKSESATVFILADQWYADKSTNPNKPLRQDTLDDIEETKNLLQRLFPKERISAVPAQPIDIYLRKLKVSNRRRFNRWNLLSQFWNWAIKNKHTDFNPCKEIEIVVEETDPETMTIEEVEDLLRKCEEPGSQELLPYVVLCLFVGLRPTEAALMHWEWINFETNQLKVPGKISKIKKTRVFQIEPTVALWLKDIAKTSGALYPENGLREKFEEVKIALGYELQGENEGGKKWIADGMRHTFASFWMARKKDKPNLAYIMGTSVKMIDRHYHDAESEFGKDEKNFWGLLPAKLKMIKDLEAIEAEKDAELLEPMIEPKTKKI